MEKGVEFLGSLGMIGIFIIAIGVLIKIYVFFIENDLGFMNLPIINYHISMMIYIFLVYKINTKNIEKTNYLSYLE